MKKMTAPEMLYLDVFGADSPLLAMDAGAKGGLRDAAELRSVSQVVGFEPDVRAASQLAGLTEDIPTITPARGNVLTVACALAGTDGAVDLNLALQPGAASTLRPNAELLRHFSADNWHELGEIVAKVQVPAVTLKTAMNRLGLSSIDFIKLDTQGNEYDILESAGPNLKNIGVIKTEVELLRVYEGQKLFQDVSQLLDRNGFELVDLQTEPRGHRFHQWDDLDDHAYRLVWGDAIYVHQPYATAGVGPLRKAFILNALGYADLAGYIVSINDAIDDRQKATVLRCFREHARKSRREWKRRLARMLEKRFRIAIDCDVCDGASTETRGRWSWKRRLTNWVEKGLKVRLRRRAGGWKQYPSFRVARSSRRVSS